MIRAVESVLWEMIAAGAVLRPAFAAFDSPLKALVSIRVVKRDALNYFCCVVPRGRAWPTLLLLMLVGLSIEIGVFEMKDTHDGFTGVIGRSRLVQRSNLAI